MYWLSTDYKYLQTTSSIIDDYKVDKNVKIATAFYSCFTVLFCLFLYAILHNTTPVQAHRKEKTW